MRENLRIERRFRTQNPNHRLTHIGGMALGLMSVVVLVWADVEDGKGGVSAGGKRVITQYYYITLCITGSLIVKRFLHIDLEKKRLGVQPTFHITRFFLAFFIRT